MGLLTAVRTDWSADPRPMATERAPAARVDRIRLRPLGLGATLELLAARTAFSQVDRCCCRYTTSRGNPLFALELAAGAHANSLPGLLDTVRMPDSLRRLVLERVTLLPPGSRDVLLVRSLSTETALLAICAAASNPATAYTDLEVGIRAGLLRGRRRCRLRSSANALGRPEDASPSVRRAAHRRLAAAVRGPEARARHLAFGAEGSDEAVASELEDAARAAAHRGACDTAAELAELAITLSPLSRSKDRERCIILAASDWGGLRSLAFPFAGSPVPD